MENKKIRYAIIGAGFGRYHHSEALKTVDEAEIVVVCDKHIDRAKECAEIYNIPNVTSDYMEAVTRDDVDAVVVATSDQAHCEVTIAALRAGKHVLCEKPMSLFVDECKQMIKEADKSGKILMVGQVCRYTPAFMKVKELVDSGVIGELFYVESEYAHDYAEIPGVDNWRTDANRDPIIGGACHSIDLLRWIAGNPTEVSAYSNHKVLTSWPVNDCTVAIYKYPNDVIGKVFTSIGCKRNGTLRTCIYGTKGTIICSNSKTTISLFLKREEGDNKEFDQLVAHEIPVEINSHNVRGEHIDFIKAIKNNGQVLTTGREGASTVAVCCATVESAKKGRAVKIEYDF